MVCRVEIWAGRADSCVVRRLMLSWPGWNRVSVPLHHRTKPAPPSNVTNGERISKAKHTSTQVAASRLQLRHHPRHLRLLRLQLRLRCRQVRFQLGVFVGLDDQRRVADDGAEELLFGDLFEVGEAELGEEFLCGCRIGIVVAEGMGEDGEDVCSGDCVLCSGLDPLRESRAWGSRRRRLRRRSCGWRRRARGGGRWVR